MNRKKIVIIYNATHHVLLFKSELIHLLKNNKFKVIVLASKDSYFKELEKIVDELYEINVDSSGVNPLKDAFLIFQIYKLLVQIKPNIVLNFTIKPVIYGTFASKLVGQIDVINTITGLGTAFLSNGLANKVATFFYKYVFKYSDLVFFQNPDDNILFKKLNIISKTNTKLISGSGVDLQKFKPITVKKNNNIKILFMGRIIADKGVYELINAAKIIIKEFDFVKFSLMGMVGVKNNTSISREEVDHWVNEKIIEYIPFKDDIREVLSESDLVVLPSYREGTPKTLIEAASMAKPLIATDVPGCREVVINNYNGFLCEVKNSISLYKSIKKFILLSQASKLEMGLKSRSLAEKKFDVNIVNNKYLNEIKNFINNEK